MDSSGPAPEVGVPLSDRFPPDPPIVREVVASEEEGRRVDDEGAEVDDESEIISVVGPLSIVGGFESEGVTFEDAVGRAGSSQRQRLRWIRLDYRFPSFQTSQYPLTFY